MLVKPTTVNFLRLFAVCVRARSFLRVLADRILNSLRLELLALKAQFNFFLPLACSCGARTSCATSCACIIFGLYCMLPTCIRPTRRFDFEIVRNNFGEWLRVWKMRVLGGKRDLLKVFQRTKNRYIDVCENEVRTLKSVKIQFSLLVRFSKNRGEEVKRMEHYFNRMQLAILNEHNMVTLNHLLNEFIDHVKGEIEAWSQRGSGWVIDEILEAFMNVAQYQPLRGGSYIVLPAKLKNKKAILNIQNRDALDGRFELPYFLHQEVETQ